MRGRVDRRVDLSQVVGSFDLLAETDVAEIEAASLQVLERTGIWVESDDALDIFADGNCEVDRESHVVRIPGEVVEEALAAAPSSFSLYRRNSDDHIVLGDGTVHFMTGGIGVTFTDRRTGEQRDGRKSDVVDACRLWDWCDNIEVMLEPIEPKDVGPAAVMAHILHASLTHSTKPRVVGPSSQAEAEVMVEMAAAVAGGRDALAERPTLCMASSMVSPLQMGKAASDALQVGARAGLPVGLGTMPMPGATAPATLAGTLVLGNAEALSALVFAQLISKGIPYLYVSTPTPLDLRLALSTVGSPEQALGVACGAQLARLHGLPLWSAGL